MAGRACRGAWTPSWRPGGADLSAGQAQLLAFVRVFLGDPGLVVLDEASSRLDPATEALVEGAVDRLLRGRTAVVIAHRLGTLRRADDVAVLDGGRLVEWGPRARLAADPGSRLFALLRAGADGGRQRRGRGGEGAPFMSASAVSPAAPCRAPAPRPLQRRHRCGGWRGA